MRLIVVTMAVAGFQWFGSTELGARGAGPAVTYGLSIVVGVLCGVGLLMLVRPR